VITYNNNDLFGGLPRDWTSSSSEKTLAISDALGGPQLHHGRAFAASILTGAVFTRSSRNPVEYDAALKAAPRPVPDSYSPPTISNGDTQLTAGSCRVLHFGQVSTWVPVSRLPSAERQSDTDMCHALMQERPGLQ
jgi:hypothetical protein